MNPVVRQAIPTDAKEIATIHVKMWKSAYKGKIPSEYLNSLSITDKTKSWEKHLNKTEKDSYTYVVDLEGLVVGWCTAGTSRDKDISDKTGEIYGIYIHPDHVRNGFGKLLIHHATNKLKDNGYSKATLWVLDTNTLSQKWYESLGWKPDGHLKKDKREDFILDEIRYTKHLDQNIIS